MELPSHAAADVTHYKYWARQVAIDGISSAYSGRYPETAAIYPPVTMYGYWVAGKVYQLFYDPAFNMEDALTSHSFTIMVKWVAVLPFLLMIIIVAILTRSYSPGGTPLLGASLLALNPASLFDVAFWGQPDAVHSLLLLVSIYCIEKDRRMTAFIFAGLAMATKPQSWVLLPFFGYVCIRRFGFIRTIQGALLALFAALATCLPFVLYGTFTELFRLPVMIRETMPVVSANAHNLWWLITRAQPEFIPDSNPLIGSITYWHAAMCLMALVIGNALWRTDPWATDGRLASMASYLVFGWFLVTTRAHENHAYLALPLLAMTVAGQRFLLAAFVVLSSTIFLNMAMHDFGLEELRVSWLLPGTWQSLQLANSMINVSLFIAWTLYLIRGKRSDPRTG